MGGPLEICSGLDLVGPEEVWTVCCIFGLSNHLFIVLQALTLVATRSVVADLGARSWDVSTLIYI